MQFLKRYLKGDFSVWIIIFLLMIVSLLAVYSSTGTLAYAKRGGNTSYFVMKHLLMLLMGFGAAIFVHRIPPRYIAGLANVILISAIISLFAVLFIGTSINGASRWLNLGFFSFQPSELGKIAIVVFTARQLAMHHDEPDTRKAFLPIILAMGVVAGLIFKENLSTFLIIVAISILMMIIGRMPIKYLLGTMVVIVGLIALVFVIAPYVPQLKRVETWKSRIERQFSADQDVSGRDYQSIQSKKAIASGGVAGKGPGKSYYRSFLPMAFSDFIFSIILEEYGLFGGVLIILLFLYLMIRGMNIARYSKRPFQKYMVLGFTMLIVMQAFINMMVCVGFIPVTGQTLPLVSMGGSSNVFMGMALGAILGVSRFTQEENEKEKELKKAAA